MITNLILVVTLVILIVCDLYLKNGKQYKVLSRLELCVAGAYFFIAIFAFLYFTGILVSGFHLIDDKDVYIWVRDSDSIGAWNSFLNRLKLDMQVRFRYTYVVLRFLQSYFWGDNFTLWHFMYGILTSANMYLAYYYARFRKCPMSVAFSFAVTIFVGCWQTQVIWRLGPQENICVFCLLLSIISMRKVYDGEGLFWRIMRIVSVILLAGSKESFLLLLPALPFLILIWDVLDRKVSNWETFIKWVKSNLCFILFVYILFFACIFMLVTFIGGTSFGYAGVDNSFGISDWIKGILGIAFGDLKIYELVAAMALVFMVYEVVKMDREKRLVTTMALVLMFLLLSANMGIQFILHAKSGLLARYTLPLSFIIVYFAFVGIGCIHEFSEKNHILFLVYFGVMGILLMAHVDDEIGAREYADDGATITALFAQVSDVNQDGDKILVDIDFEQDYSSAVYLLYKYGIRDVYNVNYSDRDDDRYYNVYDSDYDYLDYGPVNSIDGEEADIIIREKNMSVETAWAVDDTAYSLTEYGNYQLLVRNKN